MELLIEQPSRMNTRTANETKLLLVAPTTKVFTDLTKLLSENGIKIKQVNKFSEGMKILLNYKPDIILIDSCKSEIAALEFCNTIKSINNLKESSVIILSDRKDELMEISAFNTGADDFIFISFEDKCNG